MALLENFELDLRLKTIFSFSKTDLVGVVNVIATEDERDVVAEVGLSGNVDTEQRSGFHEHDPVGDELNLVPGL